MSSRMLCKAGGNLRELRCTSRWRQQASRLRASEGCTFSGDYRKTDSSVLGTREGKQPTFALLDEWVPNARRLDREEALAELALRYFTSHGPATVQDCVWWSGLTAIDVRAGFDTVKSRLANEVVDGRTYWFSSAVPVSRDRSPRTFLLPNYDEYFVGYRDRSAACDPSSSQRENFGNIVFNPTVVIGGRIAGTWKRTVSTNSVVMGSNDVRTLSEAEEHAFNEAARRYGKFLGMPVVGP